MMRSGVMTSSFLYNGREFEVDFRFYGGKPDLVYNGNYLPGDPPELEILGGKVELRSYSGLSTRKVLLSEEQILWYIPQHVLNKNILI
jgi:hypothetical protein